MGSVCSAGSKEAKDNNGEVEGKRSVEKVNKSKNFVIVKKGGGDSYSNSRTNSRVKDQKKKIPESHVTPKKKQVSRKGSFLGRAGERAVEVLDTLGSSMPKLSNSNGFNIGMVPKRNKISILAFEVANTISRGVDLFHSLSQENIEILKKEIFQSEGLQLLVSNDTKELLSFVEADKREEFNVFSQEVARFGNMCKDTQWHNLDRYFSGLDLEVLSNKQPRVEAEKAVQDLSSLTHITAELYHELNALDRFQQDYQQKVKEMESLNLPLNGEGLIAFQVELKHQRKFVKSLQKKSLWSKNLEEIVEKLVGIVIYTHQAISEFLGKNGSIAVKNCKSSQRLGEAGLALHYANIINHINVIASRPTILPPNMRDTLYQGLPNNIKSALQSRLQNDDVKKELSVAQVKAEMDKTLQWLTPFATNTTKVHQDFGWVGEWANASNELGNKIGKENKKLIRLQTLHYSEKQKIDFHILELLTWLHRLVTSFLRYRHNTMKSSSVVHRQSCRSKALHFHSKMLQFISDKPQLCEEDRRLLDEVSTMRRRFIPDGVISKSENLDLTKKKENMVLHLSSSVGSSPAHQGFLPIKFSLDVMDGIRDGKITRTRGYPLPLPAMGTRLDYPSWTWVL